MKGTFPVWLAILAMEASTLSPAVSAAPPPPISQSSKATAAEFAAARKQAAELTKQLRKVLASRKNSTDADNATLNDCVVKLSLLGEPGIESICGVAREPACGPTAINRLALMFHPRPDLTARAAVMTPIQVSSLSPGSLGAIGRIVPLLKQISAVTDPDKASLRSDAITLLAVAAPRLPAANVALVDLIAADSVPSELHPVIAGLAVDFDPAARRTIDAAAARGSASAKAINDLIHFWSLPAVEAVPKFKTLTGDEQVAMLSAIPADGKLSGPILVQLLGDSSVADTIADAKRPLNPQAIHAAILSPVMAVRVRAAALLPDSETLAGATILADALLQDSNVPERPAERIQAALARLGNAGLKQILEKTRDPDKAATRKAVRILSWYDVNELSTARYDPALVNQCAESLASFLTDNDLPLRIEAASTLGRWHAPALPALRARIQTFSDPDCEKVSRALIAQPATDGPSIDQNAIGWANASVESLAKDADAALGRKVQRILDGRNAAVADAVQVEEAKRPLSVQLQAAIDSFKTPGTHDQRLDAIKQVSDLKSPVLIPAFIGLCTDPDFEVRLTAARWLINRGNFTRTDAVLVAVMKIVILDPYVDTRRALSDTLASGFDGLRDLGMSQSRVLDIVEHGDDDARWAFASMLGIQRNRATGVRRESRTLFLKPLLQLTTDSSQKVRIAAAHSIAGWFETPDPAPLELLKSLERLLTDKDSKVRDAAMDAVLFLQPATLQTLASGTDPLLQSAALLSIEFPRDAPGPEPAYRAPIDVVAKALNGPSPRFRYMAARSILWDDPADPTRAEHGLAALLAAANSQRAEVATDALDALEPRFCGPLVPDPETHMFTRTGRALRDNITPWPVVVTNILYSALSGTTPDRLKVIDRLGISEPRYLGGRWDLYQRLLADPDLMIRNEALGSARKVIFKAIDDYKARQPKGATFRWP